MADFLVFFFEGAILLLVDNCVEGGARREGGWRG